MLRLHGYFHDEGRVFLMVEFAAKGEFYKLMQDQPYRRFEEKRAARVSGLSVVRNPPLLLLIEV